MSRPATAIGAALLLSLLAGCERPTPSAAGSRASPAAEARESGAGDSAATAPGFPRTVRLDDGTALELAAPPRRILPVNATALDVVLALAEPDRIAAVAPVSLVYSPAAAGLEWDASRELGRYTVENVLAWRPDLVVNNAWQDQAVTRLLSESGVPVLTLRDAESLAELCDCVRTVARALGEEQRGADVVADLERRSAALAERSARGGFAGQRICSYSNFGSGGSSAGAGTSYDLMFALAGLVNATAAADVRGFGDVDNELLLTLDPDWILVGVSAEDPDHSASAEYLATEPALSGLRAVREGRVVRLPAQLYTTSSHYLVDAAEALLDELERIEGGG